MNKEKTGWILALSMIFTQNVSVWAKEDALGDLSKKLVYGEQFAFEKLEEGYQDRFIVKYKTDSSYRLYKSSSSDLKKLSMPK